MYKQMLPESDLGLLSLGTSGTLVDASGGAVLVQIPRISGRELIIFHETQNSTASLQLVAQPDGQGRDQWVAGQNPISFSPSNIFVVGPLGNKADGWMKGSAYEAILLSGVVQYWVLDLGKAGALPSGDTPGAKLSGPADLELTRLTPLGSATPDPYTNFALTPGVTGEGAAYQATGLEIVFGRTTGAVTLSVGSGISNVRGRDGGASLALTSDEWFAFGPVGITKGWKDADTNVLLNASSGDASDFRCIVLDVVSP